MYRPLCVMAALAPACVMAQQAPAEQTPSIMRSFGDTGLMARFNSSEQYGSVQSRTGLYMAHNSLAQSSGDTTGFRDDVTSLVLPVNALFPVPGAGGRLQVKLGYTGIFARGSAGHRTQIDTDSQNALGQIVYLAGDDILLGVGVIREVSDVSMRHNGGDIRSEGTGVRADMLYRFAPAWGASLRLSRLSGDATTRVPRGTATMLVNRQGLRRIYGEAALVGTLRPTQLSLVPRGWVMRPSIAGVWQQSRFAATVNNLGAAVAGRKESYMLGIATIRLEKDGFRPWRLLPYVEGGLERELRNSVAQVDDDPSTAYLRAGLAMNVGGKGRLDIYAARRDSLKGTFQSTTMNMLLSLSF